MTEYEANQKQEISARDKRILERCQRAKELQDAGKFEEARAALGRLWSKLGESPRTKGLGALAQAELLLRAGALTGFIGSSQRIEGTQEAAKDLISESAALFRNAGEPAHEAEALRELGYCYWREGAHDEARVVLGESLKLLHEGHDEQRAQTLLRLAIVESSATRYHDALHILTKAAPLFDASGNDAKRGTFHMELAVVLDSLAAGERREDYADRALLEYAAASYHFEGTGHTRYRAAAENNYAYLLFKRGRFAEAHEHLDCARRLFTSLRDPAHAAQVDETRARILVAEGRFSEAERAARAAISRLENISDQALLAEALMTQGVALARLNRNEDARAVLRRSVDVASHAGNFEGAGLSALTMLEELHGQLSRVEEQALYALADDFLARTQHQESLARLRAVARRVLLDPALQRTSTRPLKVFLCHASEDKAAVRELYTMLLSENVDPWLDEEKLLPGETWQEEIEKALRSTDVVVVCLSNKSVSKEGFVQKEIREALNIADEKPEGTIFIIPLRFEDCTVPMRLTKWQRVDLYGRDNIERLKQSLLKRAGELGLS